MFHLSFSVSDHELSETLSRLHQIVPTVSVKYVSSLNSQEAPDFSNAAIRSQPKVAKTSRPGKIKVKRHYRRAPDGHGTQEDRALAILRQYGAGEFTAQDFLSKTEDARLNKAAAYRAIRIEMQLGNLNRVENGLYQRSGQAMAESLGLKKQA